MWIPLFIALVGKTYEVPTKHAGEALLEQRGYGAREPEVRMQNLMMVGGSEAEGMDMSQHHGPHAGARHEEQGASSRSHEGHDNPAEHSGHSEHTDHAGHLPHSSPSPTPH
jgi:hypothetical protein